MHGANIRLRSFSRNGELEGLGGLEPHAGLDPLDRRVVSRRKYLDIEDTALLDPVVDIVVGENHVECELVGTGLRTTIQTSMIAKSR